MPEPAELEKIAASYVDLVANASAADVTALYADDATVEDPVGSDPLCGKEQILGFYQAIEGMDKTATLKWCRVVADTAVFEFELITRSGDAAFSISPIDIMTFDDDGKITSMRAVWAAEHFKQV